MDCSLPGSSVHGISQARILEWLAISFSRMDIMKKKIILVDFLLQISVYKLETRISLYMWKEGGKVGDSPYGLSIKGTYPVYK